MDQKQYIWKSWLYVFFILVKNFDCCHGNQKIRWNNEDFNNTILNKFSPPSELTVYLDSGSAGPDNDDEVVSFKKNQKKIEKNSRKIEKNSLYFFLF